MTTQAQFDSLARRVLFLEKDRARMAERVKKLEERLDALTSKEPSLVLYACQQADTR